jgi:hypothetical protein
MVVVGVERAKVERVSATPNEGPMNFTDLGELVSRMRGPSDHDVVLASRVSLAV